MIFILYANIFYDVFTVLRVKVYLLLFFFVVFSIFLFLRYTNITVTTTIRIKMKAPKIEEIISIRKLFCDHWELLFDDGLNQSI